MLIICKGVVESVEDDFDELVTYAQKRKTKVTGVDLWSFEGSTIAKLTVTYANGGIGTFHAEDIHNIAAYCASIDGWPKPTVHLRPLPRIGVPLIRSEPAAEPATVAEPAPEAPARRRRVRPAPSQEHGNGRVRRVR